LISLISCTKEKVIPKQPDNQKQTNMIARVTPESNTGSFPIDFIVFDCNTGEYVHLIGTANWTYDVSDSEIIYNQKILDLTGTGETTGIGYTGMSSEEGIFTVKYSFHTSMQSGANTQAIRLLSANGDLWNFSASVRYTTDEEGRYVVLFQRIVGGC
jgi:hypothetical protein